MIFNKTFFKLHVFLMRLPSAAILMGDSSEEMKKGRIGLQKLDRMMLISVLDKDASYSFLERTL